MKIHTPSPGHIDVGLKTHTHAHTHTHTTRCGAIYNPALQVKVRTELEKETRTWWRGRRGRQGRAVYIEV